MGAGSGEAVAVTEYHSLAMTNDDRPINNEDACGRETEVSSPAAAELVEGVDYYIEGGLFVFTGNFLLKRGYCCENDCRHCPYSDTKPKRT